MKRFTGRKAFDGDTATDIITGVVTRDPNWSLLPTGTPWRINDLLTRALVRAGSPVELFEDPYELTLDPNRANFDVAPDGKGFVMLEAEQGTELSRQNVVLNWAEELERLVPSRN